MTQFPMVQERGDSGATARAFTLWLRMVSRFQLDLPVEKRSRALTDVIVPITSADQLLSEGHGDTASLDLSGSIRVTAHTVPLNERWHLKGVYVTPTIAASQLYLVIDSNVIAIEVATTAERFLQLQTFQLEAGDEVQILGTGNAGDTSERVDIIYTGEAV